MKLLLVENEKQIQVVAKLAKEVWEQHYTPIIGAEQVAYMLKNFQSTDTISKQLKDGYQYFIIQSKDNSVGYLSILLKENELFLSKIYVLHRFQGKGFGKFAMNFIIETARNSDKPKIVLTVNKENTNSIKAYKKMGFKKTDSIITYIGGGYVMDDFVMEKKLGKPIVVCV